MNLYRRILSRNGGTVDIIERFTSHAKVRVFESQVVTELSS